jgi:hypothetical protein
MSKKKDFTWRVTNTDGKVNIEFGPKLSEAPFETDTKLMVLGKGLVSLGTRLLTSSVGEGDDY